MYFDYAETPAPTDRAALKSFLDDLREGQKDRQEQMGGKLTVMSETDITFDGYPGRFMVADMNGNRYLPCKDTCREQAGLCHNGLKCPRTIRRPPTRRFTEDFR